MESDRFKLGLFLILSFIIICFLFVVFGLFDYGTKKVQIVTLFEESVAGLETGSMVQLRGVPIGRVKDITISMNDNLIRVDMEINIKKVRIQALGGEVETAFTESSFYQLMRKEIGKGLCAQIQMNGITGGKTIGLDYVPKDESPLRFAKPGFNKNGVFYIPSVPSTMIDMRNRLLTTLEKIASVDYKGISDRAEALLTAAENVISDPNIGSTLKNMNWLTAELEKSVNALNKSVPPERLEKIAVDTQESLAGMKVLIEKLEKSVDAAKVSETSEAFRNAATTVAENKRLIRETLVRLGTALDRLSELLQTLDENPESVIQGKHENAKGK